MMNPKFDFKSKLISKKFAVNFDKKTDLFLSGSNIYYLYSETPKVKKWKNFFLNTAGGRQQIKILMKKQHKFSEIKDILREHELPEELAFLPFVESFLISHARSKAGAVGLWQFMGFTARNFGLKVNWWCDERLNSEKSTIAAINYLKKLYGMFGDWQFVILAYNCGEYGLSRKIKKYGRTDVYKKLPLETQEFLVKIKALIQLFNDYNMKSKDQDNMVYVSYPLKGFWDLNDLAYKLHYSSHKLKKLNPEYKYGYALYGTNYIRIPRELYGKIKTVKSSYHSNGKIIKLKIKRGDTIYAISRRFHIGYKKLLDINGIRNPRKIRPGRIIYVPILKRKNG
jgi:membrane-bound lytic murein transglycosylase D